MTDGTFTLVDARSRKYLTAKERERFLAAARSRPKPTVQTLARTLAMTGCRVSEALGIRACDVDLEASEVRIATLKRRTDQWRAVPVPEDLVALELMHRLRRLQASVRGANRPLWPITRQTANRQVGAIMRTAGFEGPQAFRSCGPGRRDALQERDMSRVGAFKMVKRRARHAYSSAKWSPIPRQSGHRFHSKVISHSRARWSPIPLAKWSLFGCSLERCEGSEPRS